MKIWFLSTEYPPFYTGGISTYTKIAAKSAAKLGHEVVVFTRGNSDSITKYSKNLTVVRINAKSEHSNYFGYWTDLSLTFSEKILWYSNSFGIEPDVIEAQDYNGLAYYFLQKRQIYNSYFNNTKVFIYIHTPTFELNRINHIPEFKMSNYWISQMEKFCLLAADGVLAPSFFIKNEIEKSFKLNKDIKKILYPLPYNSNSNEVRWFNNSEKNDQYLYIGRLEYRKGVLRMLNEFEQLWNEGKDVKLKIIGGDTFFYPKNKSIEELIKEKYSNQIKKGLLILQKPQSFSKLHKEISSCKAVILPSIYENLPYVVIQSMWIGAPIIVSKQGGQAEIINDDSGFVFDWNKKYDFLDKIKEFESIDEKTKKKIGKNAYKRIKELCDPIQRTIEKLNYYNNISNRNIKNKYFCFVNNESNKNNKKNVEEYPEIKGLLSIIIPYYNLGKYLPDAVSSALNSDYHNKELIIVDDGSDDKNSIRILNNIKKKHPQIRIITTKNNGLSNARNIGAKNAKGEFIAFLDADNVIHKTFYKKAINILEKYENVGFVYSWIEYFGETKGVWPTFNTEFPLLLLINMLDALSVTRKKLFLNYGLNRKELVYGMEDWDSWISICENGYFGVSIPEKLLKYRVRNSSMSRNFNNSNILFSYKLISNKHKYLYKKYGYEIYNLLQSNGPGYLWNNPSLDLLDIDRINKGSVSPSGIDPRHKELFLKIYRSKYGQTFLRWFYKFRIQKIIKFLKIID